MKLSINIDHAATIRQARGGNEPDPVEAAKFCEEAGADGIVCHLREDRRHIIDRDVYELRQTIKTKLDLEMAASPEIITIALEVVPELVTLVPEKRMELTTEGGLDAAGQLSYLKSVVARFHQKNILVSLFIDPVQSQIDAAKASGADMIELHTGEYADAVSAQDKLTLAATIKIMAEYGKKSGLGVNAGHGLHYNNIAEIARIDAIDELSIGHAVIARALFCGLKEAVGEMRRLMDRAGKP